MEAWTKVPSLFNYGLDIVVWYSGVVRINSVDVLVNRIYSTQLMKCFNLYQSLLIENSCLDTS